MTKILRYHAALLFFFTLSLIVPIASSRAAIEPVAFTSEDIPSGTEHLIASFLTSESPMEAAVGAKLLYQQNWESKEYTDLAAYNLQNHYKESTPIWDEANSWFLLVISQTENQRYYPLVKEVYQSANTKKLKRYAKRALRKLDKPATPATSFEQNLTAALSKNSQLLVKHRYSSKDFERISVGSSVDEVYSICGFPNSVRLASESLLLKPLLWLRIQGKLNQVELLYEGYGALRFENNEGVLTLSESLGYWDWLQESKRKIQQTNSDFEREILTFEQNIVTKGHFAYFETAQQIQFSGISDERVFDPVANHLNLRVSQGIKPHEAYQLGWYLLLLGRSGNEKYRLQLAKIAADMRKNPIRNEAKKALVELNNNIRWNPIISNGLDKAPKGELELYRALNLVNSSEYELRIAGLRRAYRLQISSPKFIKATENLLERIGYLADDRKTVNVAQWSIKYLKRYGNKEQYELMQNLGQNAESLTVRLAAREYTSDAH
ncbi:hypothetical protein P886_4655 [Alteromonadaceae bacterium 2753L.S.0a.02]|nr:hypothetical protein P886_4655 [Alteromonadaceae bacterium 2753L.S.0a.02]